VTITRHTLANLFTLRGILQQSLYQLKWEALAADRSELNHT